MYWHEHRSKKKRKKWFWKRLFSSWSKTQFLKKLWKMWENIEISKLSQQKEAEAIWCQNQMIKLQSSLQKICCHRNETTQILMNKPVYLGLSILKLSKILMCGFWYDYVKPKYGEKAKFEYIETDL